MDQERSLEKRCSALSMENIKIEEDDVEANMTIPELIESMTNKHQNLHEQLLKERLEHETVVKNLRKEMHHMQVTINDLENHNFDLQECLEEAEARIDFLEMQNKSALTTECGIEKRCDMLRSFEKGDEHAKMDYDNRIRQLSTSFEEIKQKLETYLTDFGRSKEDCNVNRGKAKEEKTAPTKPTAESKHRWDHKEVRQFQNHGFVQNLTTAQESLPQDGSLMNASRSFNVLPITDSDGDKTQNLPTEHSSTISSRVYAQRLESVSFPKNIYDSHDEYCDETQIIVDQALAMGLKDLDVAIILRDHIQRSPLRSSLLAELKEHLPSTKQVMVALRNCEKTDPNMTSEQKFKLLKPRHQESWYNYAKRVEKYFDDHRVADAQHKNRMIKEHLIRATPNLPDLVANIISSPSLALADLAQYIQDEMTKIKQPRHLIDSTITPLLEDDQILDQQSVPSPQNDSFVVERQDQGMALHKPPQGEPIGQQRSGSTFHPRRRNGKRPICENCQRLGHGWQDCQWEAFCSLCNEEGHQNSSHTTDQCNYKPPEHIRQAYKDSFVSGGMNKEEQNVFNDPSQGNTNNP